MDKRLIDHITPTLQYNDYPDVLSVNDVAALLQLGRNNAYKLVQSGKLKSVKSAVYISACRLKSADGCTAAPP